MKNLFKYFFTLAMLALAICSFANPEILGMSIDSGVSLSAIGFAPLFGVPGIENMGGLQGRLAFISQYDVSSVPMLPSADEVLEEKDLSIAKGSFIFKEGTTGKPQYIYATDKTVSYNAENQGETDGQSFHITGEFFYPGTVARAAAFSRKVNNTPGYLILITPEGDQILVGQPGLPCTIKPSFAAGQARADRRGFKYTFEADSFAPYAFLETPIDFDELASEAGEGETGGVTSP